MSILNAKVGHVNERAAITLNLLHMLKNLTPFKRKKSAGDFLPGNTFKV